MAALSWRTFGIAVVGIGRLSLVIGAAAALTFGGLALLLPPAAAALLGVVAYGAIIFSTRALGLSDAWTYVRGLQ